MNRKWTTITSNQENVSSTSGRTTLFSASIGLLLRFYKKQEDSNNNNNNNNNSNNNDNDNSSKLTINEWGWVSEYLMKNYGDLHNSSYDTKAEFNNCFIIHSK